MSVHLCVCTIVCLYVCLHSCKCLNSTITTHKHSQHIPCSTTTSNVLSHKAAQSYITYCAVHFHAECSTSWCHVTICRMVEHTMPQHDVIALAPPTSFALSRFAPDSTWLWLVTRWSSLVIPLSGTPGEVNLERESGSDSMCLMYIYIYIYIYT